MTDSLETKEFMTDSLEAKKLLIIRILQILEYYSDVNHPLTQEEIIKKLYDNYGIEAERKAIGRNIALLQDMFERESMNKTATAIVIESDKRKGTFLDTISINRHDSFSLLVVISYYTIFNRFFQSKPILYKKEPGE